MSYARRTAMEAFNDHCLAFLGEVVLHPVILLWAVAIAVLYVFS